MTRKFFGYLIILALTISSCARYDRLLYVSSTEEKTINPIFTNYLLCPLDVLYIRIVSADQQVSNMFRTLGDERTGAASEMSLYLTSYIIDKDSTITLPVVGKIKAAGMSVVDFEKMLQKAIDEVVIETHVSVRLINYRITVIGEVTRPGVFQVYQPNATIFDIIAKAGDISNIGNRNEVTVLRVENNVTANYKIDLGSIESLKSPVYYVYPNDIIYVKPLRYKTVRENIPIYTLMLSSITTFLLILNLLNK